MFSCQHNIQRVRERGGDVSSIFTQRNHSNYSFLNCCSTFLSTYDHSVKLMIRFGEEDRVVVTESDNY